jgi:hypothetical protein
LILRKSGSLTVVKLIADVHEETLPTAWVSLAAPIFPRPPERAEAQAHRPTS